MIRIKTEEDIEKIREGGRRLASVLRGAEKMVKPGLPLLEIDNYVRETILAFGDTPSFLNYSPSGARRPFPASSCISVNDEIIHGIPTEGGRVLEIGDIVTIDVGVCHEGLYTDSAITVPVGKVTKEASDLIKATRASLDAGIEAAVLGAHIGDIGHAVESVAKKGKYFITEGLCGHGVGYKIHEDPYVPNDGHKGDGPLLKVGMVLAIEPMLSIGTSKVKEAKDGYTYLTADGSLSAHFEHTIAITKNGPDILTI